MEGAGTLRANVGNAGTFRPGFVSPNDIGTLTIDGNYTQQPTGVFDIALSPIGHDVLAVSGAVMLSGTLNGSAINGFQPQLFNTFVIITAGSVSGTFTAENLPALPFPLTWLVQYNPTNVTLFVTACNPDVVSPSITRCAPNQSISTDANCQGTLPNLTGQVTATDFCDPNVAISQSPTPGTITSQETTTVTFTATDNFGNTAMCSAMVTEAVPPEITQCAASQSIPGDVNCEAMVPDITGQVTATDNCDAAVTITQSPTAGTTIGLGNTLITLTATDDVGNTETCAATITTTSGGACNPADPCAAHRPVFDVTTPQGQSDGDVDLDDVAFFLGCVTGPTPPVGVFQSLPVECQCMDTNSDLAIDLADFAAFQRCFSGRNLPADPACAR